MHKIGSCGSHALKQRHWQEPRLATNHPVTGSWGEGIAKHGCSPPNGPVCTQQGAKESSAEHTPGKAGGTRWRRWASPITTHSPKVQVFTASRVEVGRAPRCRHLRVFWENSSWLAPGQQLVRCGAGKDLRDTGDWRTAPAKASWAPGPVSAHPRPGNPSTPVPANRFG